MTEGNPPKPTQTPQPPRPPANGSKQLSASDHLKEVHTSLARLNQQLHVRTEANLEKATRNAMVLQQTLQALEESDRQNHASKASLKEANARIEQLQQLLDQGTPEERQLATQLRTDWTSFMTTIKETHSQLEKALNADIYQRALVYLESRKTE